MRFKDERTIKDLISQMVDQNKLRPKLLEAQLIADWSRIVGDHIAKYTEKIQVHKGQLILHISSPALRTELSYQKNTIKDLINKELKSDFIEEVLIK